MLQYLFNPAKRLAIINCRPFLLAAVLICNFITAQTEGKRYYAATIAFYNLENLFDTINDPRKQDEEFLPDGPRHWTGEKYKDKLEKLARVIEKLGDEDGPEILGVCETENKKVLKDLIETEKLKNRSYSIVHFESPDLRGIDVGFIYKTKYFKPFKSFNLEVKDPADPEFKTRDILVVSGVLSNDTITFMVNHWPSRRGSGKDDKRILAAETARKAVDSILSGNKDAKVILMGDFNDNPNDASISEHLNAQPEKKMTEKSLFNPMFAINKKGYGTLSHDGVWHLFDQLIMTPAVLNNPNGKYFYRKESASIFYQKWLITQDGPYTGTPFRAFSGDMYSGGYSDHLPVYLLLLQEAK